MHIAPLQETVRSLCSCSEDLEDISEQLHVSTLSDELDGLMECLPDASVPAKLAASVLLTLTRTRTLTLTLTLSLGIDGAPPRPDADCPLPTTPPPPPTHDTRFEPG